MSWVERHIIDLVENGEMDEAFEFASSRYQTFDQEPDYDDFEIQTKDSFFDNNAEKKFLFVRVRYLDNPRGKSYYYLCSDWTVKVNDIVLVPTANYGPKKATVIYRDAYTAYNAPYPVHSTKSVIRIVGRRKGITDSEISERGSETPIKGKIGSPQSVGVGKVKSFFFKIFRFGFDTDGFDAEGYNREGFNQKGYNQEGDDQEGFKKEGYNQEGNDKLDHNREV